MEKDYKPVDSKFRDCLEAAVARKQYVNLHYFTGIHEFMKVMVVVKSILTKDNMEFLALSNGEAIRLDRIIRIEDAVSPFYADIYDFTCNC